METAVGLFLMAVGALVAFTGVQNVRTKTAEDTGKRRAVNWLFGWSNSHTGTPAVIMGWGRTVAGIGLFLFIAFDLFMT